jgi:uncharacterized protein (DUF885 family)
MIRAVLAGGAFVAVVWAAPGLAAAAYVAPTTAERAAAMPANYGQLVSLFNDWRAFAQPAVKDGVADYSSAAMARQAVALKSYRARLAAIDMTGWPTTARVDARYVAAEMNGLDFFHRVLRSWARDPSFYANVFAEWSDVPAHEGPSAFPNINLYDYQYPLNAADAKALTTALRAVPINLAAAKVNLADSNAADLWRYGNRAFKEQSETLDALGKGTLVLNTLDGRRPATIAGAGPELARAVADAKAATDDFAAWVAAQAPNKTGPSGVGKDNYNWYVRNVELLPWDWDAQVTLLQRELDRSIASLRLEEVRNRDVPPVVPLTDPAAFAKLIDAKSARLSSFLAAAGVIPDTAWARAAIAAQQIDYVAPADRNFFAHVTAQDPLPLKTHMTHWIDLARMKNAPAASPIRATPPLFNIYANRSEGFATAFEEIAMQVGLYDDVPHGRELVWIMLANRAARGLASLRVQANEIDLAQAGKFHAEWTPRGWSDPNSKLVGFEQLLYLRQPGYGPSYVTGKLQLDRLMADVSQASEQAGRPFVMKDFFAQVMAQGIIPVALIEAEMLPLPQK